MFFGNAEEAQAMMMQAQMQAGLKLHLFNETVDSLDKDHLHAMAAIFGTCARNNDLISEFYGQLQAILRIKFQVCMCGADHDAEFQVPDDPSSLGGPTSPDVIPEGIIAVDGTINLDEFKDKFTKMGDIMLRVTEVPDEEEPPTRADGYPN